MSVQWSCSLYLPSLLCQEMHKHMEGILLLQPICPCNICLMIIIYVCSIVYNYYNYHAWNRNNGQELKWSTGTAMRGNVRRTPITLDSPPPLGYQHLKLGFRVQYIVNVFRLHALAQSQGKIPGDCIIPMNKLHMKWCVCVHVLEGQS